MSKYLYTDVEHVQDHLWLALCHSGMDPDLVTDTFGATRRSIETAYKCASKWVEDHSDVVDPVVYVGDVLEELPLLKKVSDVGSAMFCNLQGVPQSGIGQFFNDWGIVFDESGLDDYLKGGLDKMRGTVRLAL